MGTATEMPMEERKPCLVLAPIGEPGSAIRKHSDQTLKHIVRPAAEAYGFRAQRADEIASPVLITNAIMRRIVSDELVIADLTGANGNVMYELALRHVTRRPLVTLMRSDAQPPFDVMNSKTIFFDLTDPDNVEVAREDLKAHIEAVIANPEMVENPISAALDLEKTISALESSHETTDSEGLAEILRRVSELSSQIGQLRREITRNTYRNAWADRDEARPSDPYTLALQQERPLDLNEMYKEVGLTSLGAIAGTKKDPRT